MKNSFCLLIISLTVLIFHSSFSVKAMDHIIDIPPHTQISLKETFEQLLKKNNFHEIKSFYKKTYIPMSLEEKKELLCSLNQEILNEAHEHCLQKTFQRSSFMNCIHASLDAISLPLVLALAGCSDIRSSEKTNTDPETKSNNNYCSAGLMMSLLLKGAVGLGNAAINGYLYETTSFLKNLKEDKKQYQASSISDEVV